MNFVVKLEDGTYFNTNVGKVPDIQNAEKFHSKSLAKRVLLQSNKLDGTKISEIVFVEKEKEKK